MQATAQIIQFRPALASKKATAPVAQIESDSNRPISVTAKNECDRASRKQPWRMARLKTEFYYAYLKFATSLSFAQNCGVPETLLFAKMTLHDRGPIVDKYRAAVVEQLLTPAPDVEAVHWKRRIIANDFAYVGDDKTAVEEAIAADVAFLKAHPARQGASKKLEQS
jgi:hypothetical protein